MTLTAAIVGCGPRGMDHAAALGEVDGVSLGGVADFAESLREHAGAKLGVSAYGDASEMVAEVRPDIVVVATPHNVRSELVLPIAEADSVRAIVVEKPLALSMDEAEAMLEACDRADVHLIVGYQMRFVPHFVALVEAIQAGELGTIEHIRALSFGHLLDQGPHMVDAARALTGGSRVLWAMSQRGEALLPDAAPGDRSGLLAEITAWTTHHLALEGGVRVTMENGPLHQRSVGFGDGEEIDDYLDKRLTVVGSRGVAQFVTGGDLRVLTDSAAEWRTQPGGIKRYLSANRLFHEEVRDAVLRGTRHRCDAHDGLDSLEGLLACAESVRREDAVMLPLERGRGGVAAPARRDAQPEVSVIVPIPDHRGYAEQAVRSWTEGQTFDRDRIEVLVGSDGAEPGLEERVEPLLGPNDRMFRIDGVPEVEIYDGMARAARGRILLFTEPHCIAEPAFIEELLAHLRRTGEAGACGRSVGICSNALARMEQTVYDEGFRVWSQPGNWCKVILRAIAIDRQVYLDAGGFDTRYGRFAEFALAATLHAKGHRLGYASGAAVEHVYTEQFSQLVPHIDEFLRGDLAYRLDHPAEYCERYFGVPREWVDRRVLTKDGARAAWLVAFWALLRPSAARGGLWRSLIATLVRLGPAASAGPRPAIAWASVSLAMARMRCRIWRLSDRRMLRAYRDAWERMSRRARLRFLAAYPDEGPRSDATAPFELAELSDDRLVGFHGQERVNGTSFRWSGSVAYADIPVSPGAYRVDLDTGGLRDPRDVAPQLFFNGRRIARSRLRVDQGGIGFTVEPDEFSTGGDQRLALVSASFRPSRVADTDDDRELGLPVCSIDFTPIEGRGEG